MMAKKKEMVDIDEDYMKAIMASDIPRIKIAHALAAERLNSKEKDFLTEGLATDEALSSPLLVESGIKKKETEHYEDLFFIRRLSKGRRQCYISEYSYDKISNYLAVINKDISLTSYIDNILRHHMEEYKDDINELYKKKMQKPL